MGKLLYAGKESCSAEELLAFIRGIKTGEMRSNCNIPPFSFAHLIQDNQAWVRIGEESAIILCPDTENIVRLSYYAKDKAALGEVVQLVPETSERVVCDVIGKDEQAKTLSAELESVGFQLYAKFQRMICTSILTDDKLDLSEVTLAQTDDAPEILEMLRQEFDSLTARLPSLEVLDSRIIAKEVFVVRREGRIAAFAIFNSNKKRAAFLDYIIVRPEYRKEKMARKMLCYKWKYWNQSQHYLLWVNVLSEAIHFYNKHGFQEDGIYDYILIL